MLSLIACVSKDGGLGQKGELLWRSKEDMDFFRTTTTGHTVVMGRKTYESIGHPLKNRRNIVLTKSPICGNIEVYTSCESLDSLLIAEKDEVFVIGGASLYTQYLNRADRLLLTEVDVVKPADVFFPDFKREQYKRRVLKTFKIDGHPAEIVEYRRK